jgi:hypothetical protein
MPGDSCSGTTHFLVSTGSDTDTLLMGLDTCLWSQFNKLREHTKKGRRNENLFNMTP